MIGSALAVADLDGVDGADRRDFGGGAGEEQLVGEVEHLARNGDLAHFDAHVLRQRHHGVTRDAVEQRVRHARRVQHAVLDDEQVLAGAFAHGAVGRQADAFDEAEALGLEADELAGQIVAAGLGHGGNGVGRDALPRRHAHIDAFVFGGAEILAPFPGGDRDFDRAGRSSAPRRLRRSRETRPGAGTRRAPGRSAR